MINSSSVESKSIKSEPRLDWPLKLINLPPSFPTYGKLANAKCLVHNCSNKPNLSIHFIRIL